MSGDESAASERVEALKRTLSSEVESEQNRQIKGEGSLTVGSEKGFKAGPSIHREQKFNMKSKSFYDRLREDRQKSLEQRRKKYEQMQADRMKILRKYAQKHAQKNPYNENTPRGNEPPKIPTLQERRNKVYERYEKLLGYKHPLYKPTSKTPKIMSISDGDREEKEIAERILKKTFNIIDSQQPRKVHFNIKPIGFELEKPPNVKGSEKPISSKSIKIASAYGGGDSDDEGEDVDVKLDLTSLTEEEHKTYNPIIDEIEKYKTTYGISDEDTDTIEYLLNLGLKGRTNEQNETYNELLKNIPKNFKGNFTDLLKQKQNEEKKILDRQKKEAIQRKREKRMQKEKRRMKRKSPCHLGMMENHTMRVNRKVRM